MRIKNSFSCIIFAIFILITLTIALAASETSIQKNIKNMFIYDECCSHIDDPAPNLSMMLIFDLPQNQIK